MSVEVRTVPADLPEVDVLLDAYLDEREATFPSAQGTYARKRTPAAEFTPPNGVFALADDDGVAIGCGGSGGSRTGWTQPAPSTSGSRSSTSS